MSHKDARCITVAMNDGAQKFYGIGEKMPITTFTLNPVQGLRCAKLAVV